MTTEEIMGISSHFDKAQSHLIITVDGRFDFSCHQSFRDVYENLPQVPQTIVIDLHNATYLDSSALGMLLLLRDHTGDANTQITLQNVSDDVRKILTISNFNQLFAIN